MTTAAPTEPAAVPTVSYHLFAGASYYPSGALGDYLDSYGSLDEAVDAGRLSVRRGHWDWWSVVVQNEAGRLEEVASSG